MYKLVNWIIWRLGLSFFSFSELVISSAFEFRFVLAGINTFGREEKCFTRLMFCKYYPSNRARSPAKEMKNGRISINRSMSSSVGLSQFGFFASTKNRLLSFFLFWNFTQRFFKNWIHFLSVIPHDRSFLSMRCLTGTNLSFCRTIKLSTHS